MTSPPAAGQNLHHVCVETPRASGAWCVMLDHLYLMSLHDRWRPFVCIEGGRTGREIGYVVHYFYVFFALDLLLFLIRVLDLLGRSLPFWTVHHSVTIETCVFPPFGLPHHCGCLSKLFPSGDVSQVLDLQRVSPILWRLHPPADCCLAFLIHCQN